MLVVFRMPFRHRVAMLLALCVVSPMIVYFTNKSDAVSLLLMYYRTNGKVFVKRSILNEGPLNRNLDSPLYYHVGPYPIANKSRTIPPFYPINGTGRTVDIDADFDTTRFQQFCKNETILEAVLPVYSAPENVAHRTAMRGTVGKLCARMGCKMFFIIGVSLNKAVYDKVKTEYATQNDILIINKLDTYRDLNNKAVAMLDWLMTSCTEPKYVIHMIDDFYPNLNMILNRLRQINRTKFILARIHGHVWPFRKNTSKWYLSEAEYPYPVFPPYLVGVVYAFLNSDSALLRQAVHTVEYCWIEDVWFTGYVRQGAGFEPMPLPGDYKDHSFRSAKSLREMWNSRAGFHHLTPTQFYVIYNNIHRTHNST